MLTSNGGGLRGVHANATTTTNTASSEVEVPKDLVDYYLRNGKAIVICEAEKRTRSDVCTNQNFA